MSRPEGEKEPRRSIKKPKKRKIMEEGPSSRTLMVEGYTQCQKTQPKAGRIAEKKEKPYLLFHATL